MQNLLLTLLLSCPQSKCDLFDYVIRPVFEFDREQGLGQQEVKQVLVNVGKSLPCDVDSFLKAASITPRGRLTLTEKQISLAHGKVHTGAAKAYSTVMLM